MWYLPKEASLFSSIIFCDVFHPTFYEHFYPTFKVRNSIDIIQFLLKNSILHVTTTIDIPTPEDIIDQNSSDVGLLKIKVYSTKEKIACK